MTATAAYRQRLSSPEERPKHARERKALAGLSTRTPYARCADSVEVTRA